MPVVLGIASVLGVTGVVASSGLFYLGERVFHLNRELIQSFMYLKLSVAGHLTIFVTRTRQAFWSIRPALILLAAALGTQLIATLIAVYGIFMAPDGGSLDFQTGRFPLSLCACGSDPLHSIGECRE